jgi:hypothetical protein
VNGTLGTCSTATVCYLYDALGRRVEETATSASAIRQYVHKRRFNSSSRINKVDFTLCAFKEKQFKLHRSASGPPP